MLTLEGETPYPQVAKCALSRGEAVLQRVVLCVHPDDTIGKIRLRAHPRSLVRARRNRQTPPASQVMS